MWKASPSCRRPTSATPSNWATASSCWASPAADDNGIELRVHPTLVPMPRLIANVEGAMNAVWCRAMPWAPRCTTARAPAASPPPAPWIADLVDITRLHTPTPTTVCRTWPSSPTSWPTADPADRRGHHRLLPAPAGGRPDRRAGRITGILAEHDISIDAVLQREVSAEGENQTDLIILTHDTKEGRMNKALAADAGPADRAGADRALRKEELA
jgi:homoserine dehydrogenase